MVNLPASTVINVGGHGLSRRVKVRTTASTDTFNATGGNGTIRGLAFFHTGAFGRCFKQNNEASWHVHHNYFEASNNGGQASDIIHTSGALSYYYLNAFNNFRNNPDSFCIAFDKSPADPNHCIENHVDQNYAGGARGASGPFLYIGSRVGRAANAYNIATKPEGIHVGFNTVQTHTYSVVIECALLVHLNANSFCIAGGIVMLLRPTGPGIIDLRAVSNWYDSTDAPNVGGVIHNDDSYRNGPAAVIKGVRFMDRFDSGKYGAFFGPNASGIDFTGSHFQSMTEVGILCDGTQNVTIGSDFESCGASVQRYDRANGGPFFLGRCNFSNSPPAFVMTDRSKFVMSYETSGYKLARKFAFVGPTNSFAAGTAPGSVKGFVLIPHGLAGTPNINKCHVTCQGPPSGSGGASFEGASAIFIAADAANVTLAVYVSGLGVQGNLGYNLDLSM
ncbi:hypothetical protein [Methylobacterium sp. Leaf100]|uniref:hypothetical protein n=1 Tax=Methylobacterium sp. Leaf100 TaxID=1736252 RepID=UPI00070081D8|nr:hypothetical protein [Methylobacterium sp. Leaf100]KQP27086.1 hypothetical protein ASF25_21025 [Methylobacterium sp. Leaf100]